MVGSRGGDVYKRLGGVGGRLLTRGHPQEGAAWLTEPRAAPGPRLSEGPAVPAEAFGFSHRRTWSRAVMGSHCVLGSLLGGHVISGLRGATEDRRQFGDNCGI